VNGRREGGNGRGKRRKRAKTANLQRLEGTERKFASLRGEQKEESLMVDRAYE
jgi:hypothetical protein